jgi:DNA-binding NarL/FixJ family response regulator
VSADIARPRVLLANLEPIALLGMTQLLEDEGLEVVADRGSPGAIVAEARRVSPDAVVVGRPDGGTSELPAQLRAAAPGAKVVVWERDETAIEVYEPGSTSSRRVDTDVRAALLSELGAVQPIGEGK